MSRFFVLALLIGCERTHAPPPPTQPPAPPTPEDVDQFVQCDAEFPNAQDLAPIAAGSPDDRKLVANLHHYAFEHICHDPDWTQAVAHCFAQAHDEPSIARCKQLLPPALMAKLTDELAAADKLAATAFAARSEPGGMSCDRMVDKHYGASALTGQLAKLAPALRQRLIDESRKQLLLTCTGREWSDALRACVYVDGDYEKCSGSYSVQNAWGFPAHGVTVPTGLDHCDRYITLLVTSSNCVRELTLRNGYLEIAATTLRGIGELGIESAGARHLDELCTASAKDREAEAKQHGCN